MDSKIIHLRTLYYDELIRLYGPRLTRQQAKQALGCSKSKILRLEKSGVLRSVKIAGESPAAEFAHVLYNASEIADLLANATSVCAVLTRPSA